MLSTGLKYHPNGPSTSNDLTLTYDDVRLQKNPLCQDSGVYASSFAHLTDLFTLEAGSPKCRRYDLTPGETIVFACYGDDTIGLHFNKWYAVNLNQSTTGIYDGFVMPYTPEDFGQLLISRINTTITSGSVTIPAGSICFKIYNSARTSAEGFYGHIGIKVLANQASTIPSRTYVEL